MSGIKIPVSADLNSQDIEAAVNKLNAQMNKLAATISAANKIKFNPIPKGALDDLKAMETRFNELKRISGGLNQRINATGQGGVGFGDLNWDRLYEDPATRARKMQQAYRHVTAGTSYAIPAGSAGGGGSGVRTGGGSGPFGFGAAAGSIAGRAASAGLRATGSVGGVVASAGESAAAGGMGAGMMGLLGGLAALAVGKAVSAVKEKVDKAGQEGIGYDTLKRTLGDVNVGFSMLQSSLRAASSRIDVTFEESQKLGSDFAKLSGISRDQAKTLADEVAVGGGFGRSFGMDPSQSNQFFAQMRQFRVTENTNDSRRLAVMIGEAVGKSGSFGKADEILSSIAAFTATQARNGLGGVNATGYAAHLSGLMASGIPGLDVGGAASLLSRVNGAIAGGGGAGEAGQNFLFSVLGRRLGLNPVQAAILQQQGAFGSGRSAFGSDLSKQFYRKFGGGVSGAAAQDDRTNLSVILSELQARFSSNPDLMLNATARTLGINESQARALHVVGPASIGGMAGRMGRLGLDLSKLSSTGISALGQIEGADRAGLLAQANALGRNGKPLSNEEKDALKDAMKGPDEKLRDVLTTLTYTREQEQTDGGKTRESIQQVDKRLQELATGLVGPANDMRNAMIYMVGGGKKTMAQINKEVAQGEFDEKTAPLRARSAEIDSMLNGNPYINSLETDGMGGRRGGYSRSNLTDAQRKSLIAERDQLAAQIAAAGMERDISSSAGATQERLAKLAAVDARLGLKPGTSAGLVQTESGFDGSKVSKKGARGFFQIMPRELAVMSNRLGRNLDPTNFDDGLEAYEGMMRENLAHFNGDQTLALRGYHGGWDTSAWGSANAAYAPSVAKNANKFATPLPSGAKVGTPAYGGGAGGTINVGGTIYLKLPNGQPAADPLEIKTRVFGPNANGK